MSQPFGYDSSMLSSILASARPNNPKLGITGAFICRHDRYRQLIEGGEDAIHTLFERIWHDYRHLGVNVLKQPKVDGRLFPDWLMLHDPGHSWLWPPEEVNLGAIIDASAEALQQVFIRAAATPSCPPSRSPQHAATGCDQRVLTLVDRPGLNCQIPDISYIKHQEHAAFASSEGPSGPQEQA